MANTFTLAGTLKLTPKWVENFGVTDVTDSAAITHTAALVDGAGSGAANAYWKDQISVPASGGATVDLRALTHRAFGGVGMLAFSSVKMIVAVNNGAHAVEFGGADPDRWQGFAAGAVTVGNGGVLYSLAPGAGWPVASGNSVISLTNPGAAAVMLDIYIAGVQAT